MPHAQHITNDRPGTAVVTLECSNICNYSCWYCPPELHTGTSPWPDIGRSLAFVSDLAQRHEHVYLDLVGGEPTLWPKLLDFLGQLPPNVQHEISTNGSRTLRWWGRAKPMLKKVTMTAHMASCDNQHLISVIDLIRDTVEVHLTALYDLDHRDKIAQLGAAARERDLSFQVRPIMPMWDSMVEYGPEERAFMGDLLIKGNLTKHSSSKPTKAIWNGVPLHPSRDILMGGRTDFRGWQCLAGSMRFHVIHDGTIYAGSCRNKELGNLRTGWRFEDGPIACARSRCTCQDDIKTEKWLP